MAGIFTFAAVDCDDETNRRLCAEFEVKGYPAIKFMKPYNGKLDTRGRDFATINFDGRLPRSKDRKSVDGFCEGEYGESGGEGC